jgi:quercetin dioxygenase-like cupin family protein
MKENQILIMSTKNHLENLSSLLVKLSAIKRDPALDLKERGARKLLITELIENKEKLAQDEIWQAPEINEKCSVLLTKDFEMSIFNQAAKQDRHYHKLGTEIYLIVEGKMLIEVENKDYLLSLGDSIVVNPGSVHLVKPSQENFIAYVFSFNCKGVEDKFIVL